MPPEPTLLERTGAWARGYLYRCAIKIMQLAFVGREAHRLSILSGQTLVRDKGKFVGCGHTDSGWILRYMAYGMPAIHRVSLVRLRYDKNLKGLAFYD